MGAFTPPSWLNSTVESRWRRRCVLGLTDSFSGWIFNSVCSLYTVCWCVDWCRACVQTAISQQQHHNISGSCTTVVTACTSHGWEPCSSTTLYSSRRLSTPKHWNTYRQARRQYTVQVHQLGVTDVRRARFEAHEHPIRTMERRVWGIGWWRRRCH